MYIQEPTNNLIEILDVSYNIDKSLILDNINLNIRSKDILTIIGPNGGGKTTLAKLLINSILPSRGIIKLKKNLNIGYIPQKLYLDSLLPLRVIDFLKLNKSYYNNIDQYIKVIDVQYLFQTQISAISGGELQKILLLASLVNKPDLLIMDEPTQGLDINSQADFYNLIEKIKKEYGIAIVIISHDLHMVMKTTDYVVCLNKHICCQGKPHNILDDKNFVSLFNSFATYIHNHNHQH